MIMKKFKYILFSLVLLFIGMSPILAANNCAVCGSDALPIPVKIPLFVSKLITLAQISVPIIIIITAMIRYFKVVTSGEDKTAKEANSAFVRSLITGVSIFLVVAIVKTSFNIVGNDASSSLNCVSCFVSGNCQTKACPERSTSSDKKDNKTDTNKDSGKSTTHTSDSGVKHGGGSKKF